MTPQEQDMIGDLIDRVRKTQLAEKDPDAEQMLQQGLGRTPDSLYILAQTVLVQKYALDQAQSQLAQAKDQIQQLQQHPEPKHATSFLGNLLGMNQTPAPPPPPQAPPQGYAPPPPPPYAPVGYGAGPYPGGPAYGPPPSMGMPGGGGFLQNAMQTAAGVAAGALAFQGIESLMHGFGHAAGYGGGSGLGGFDGAEQRPTETITNNYYDDNRGDQGDRGTHDVSSAERTLGDSENYTDNKDDTLNTSGRDSLDGANDDTASDYDPNLNDASLDDNFDDTSNDNSGDNFDDGSNDDGGGGGDDSNFA
jgi:uncharacterized protein